MSAPGPFPARSAYSTKLPDRTGPTFQGAPGIQQAQFGQSAPAFTRNPTGTHPSYAHYASNPVQQIPQPGPGAGAGIIPGLNARPTAEKESNLINDLSDEQKDEINESFSIFDLDRDRHLDFHELRVALRALGFDCHKNEILQIMASQGVPKPTAQRINPPGRGGGAMAGAHPSQMLLSQSSFTRIAAQKMLERDPREEVERAFYLFDLDRKDYINLDDMRRVTRELGETSLEEQELVTMVEEFDYEGIGGVSKEAFFGICLQ